MNPSIGGLMMSVVPISSSIIDESSVLLYLYFPNIDRIIGESVHRNKLVLNEMNLEL